MTPLGHLARDHSGLKVFVCALIIAVFMGAAWIAERRRRAALGWAQATPAMTVWHAPTRAPPRGLSMRDCVLIGACWDHQRGTQ